jgi:hypothetical protein
MRGAFGDGVGGELASTSAATPTTATAPASGTGGGLARGSRAFILRHAGQRRAGNPAGAKHRDHYTSACNRFQLHACSTSS